MSVYLFIIPAAWFDWCFDCHWRWKGSIIFSIISVRYFSLSLPFLFCSSLIFRFLCLSHPVCSSWPISPQNKVFSYGLSSYTLTLSIAPSVMVLVQRGPAHPCRQTRQLVVLQQGWPNVSKKYVNCWGMCQSHCTCNRLLLPAAQCHPRVYKFACDNEMESFFPHAFIAVRVLFPLLVSVASELEQIKLPPQYI